MGRLAAWLRDLADRLDPPLPVPRVKVSFLPAACFRCGGMMHNGITHDCPDGLFHFTLTTNTAGGFYEDDEPPEAVVLAFKQGRKHRTGM